MESPFNITLDINGNDKERIGNNKRSKFSSTSIDLEKLLIKDCPLPITFDVAPIQENYFSEFSYYDILGGLFITTMSPETTALVMDKAYNEATPDYTLVDKLATFIEDKYELSNKSISVKDKKVAFLPGSNLINCLNRELLDKEMHSDEEMLIKLHPITNEETTRQLARNYGYGRMIASNESGVAYLKECGIVYTASNSEFGIAAAAMNKPIVDITSLLVIPRLSYSPIYRLFKDRDIEHNRTVLAKILNSKSSGILMPWFDDNELRIKEFYKKAMEIRSLFKPMYAASVYKYSIGKAENVVRKN